MDYVEYVGPGLTWGRILSTCIISMWSNNIKCKYMFMFPLQNLARKELISMGVSQYKMPSYQYGITMIKIRQSDDRLIFKMGISIHGKTSFILRRVQVLSFATEQSNNCRLFISSSRYPRPNIHDHWNEKVVIVMKVSRLAVPVADRSQWQLPVQPVKKFLSK